MIKEIDGFDGMYLVSSDGYVISNKTGSGSKNGAILKPCYDKDGYAQVVLRKDGKSNTKKVHRLVLITFGNSDSSRNQVNHINGIKDDNRLENLEWVNASENAKHSYDFLTRKKPDWSNYVHPKSRKIICIETGVIYDSVNKASKEHGILQSNLHHALSGRYKKSGGFSWRFVDDN